MHQGGIFEMKIKPKLINRCALLTSTTLTSTAALAGPQRELMIRSMTREGETHLSLRASALENDPAGVFPITTLDKNSFQFLIDGQEFPNQTIALTTFDASRRSNSRAVVWAYDATGVKTMKGLNKDLRALTAQEFTTFNADFMSILGVAKDKTIERVLLDPQHQDNTLAIQRQLLSDPVGVAPEAIFKETPQCVAAQKFEKWIAAGLKPTDQKVLILIGGAQQSEQSASASIDLCIKKLLSMQVNVFQIVFAKPETFTSRQWSRNPQITASGSVVRVVNLQGASRALQTARNILDKEYLLNGQLPLQTISNPLSSEISVQIVANYHGQRFKSAPQIIKLVRVAQPQNLSQSSFSPIHEKPIAPSRMNVIDNKTSLALNAWIEWLINSIIVGLIVTLRHMKRMQSGIYSIENTVEHGDTSDGPLLLVLNGKDRGREFRIRQHKVVFGRSFSCDLRLQGQRVKGKHGCLTFQGDKALLEDFSGGQLAVNGRPLRQLRIIGHGSVIQLGDLQLLFRCGEA